MLRGSEVCKVVLSNSSICMVKCSLQVDKHIRKLDADLARFEADLKEKSVSTANQKLKGVEGPDTGKKSKVESSREKETYSEQLYLS